jgi:TolA-binding protein
LRGGPRVRLAYQESKHMRLRLCVSGLLLVPTLALGASREIVELQRDVATLQDQVRALSSSTAEKLTALTVLVQQTLDAANNANKAVAVLESRVNDRLDKQSASVGQPVAVVGAKVDQLSNDFQSMRDALNDVVSRMGKLELKLVDLNNTVRTIQAPPPAPAPLGTNGASGPPVIPADTLFSDAQRDKMSGKAELALKEFNDFVQLYGDTPRAAEAQFYIGQIHYEQNDWPNALKDFDTVLERYSDSAKTPDAMLMKGRTLVKMDKRTDGAKEFRALLSKYPRHSLAATACSELKALGYQCSGIPAANKKRRAPA